MQKNAPHKVFSLVSIFHKLSLMVVLYVLSVSCSNTKYLPKGEKLYTGAEVKFDKHYKSKIKASALEKMIRPLPNSKLLGLRVKLYAYNIAKEPKGKGLNYFLKRKFGEPPVLFSTMNINRNIDLLTNYLENQGYFNATVSADTIDKNRRVKAMFKVNVGNRYRINNIVFPSDSDSLNTYIRSTSKETLLKKNQPFIFETIKEERIRIDAALKELGYFYFNPDYLIMQLDSTNKNNTVDIYIKLKKDAPDKALHVYRLNNINVYPNYSLEKDSTYNLSMAVKYHDYSIVDVDNLFKPITFDRAIFFEKDKVYTRTNHNLSLNRLVNLGAFKFVKLQLTDADSLSRHLNADFYLTPYPKHSLRFEATGTSKSNNFVGSELKVLDRNRNFLRGAEQFILSVAAGFETQLNGSAPALNSYSLTPEVSLTFPRFVTPISRINKAGALAPKTKITANYQILTRSDYYTLNSAGLFYGYSWKESLRKDHVFNLVAINFVKPTNTTAKFDSMLVADPTLKASFQQQFIIGTNYNFVYTNQLESKRPNNFYINANIDFSGNFIGLLMPGKESVDNPSKIFGTPFSQYARGYVDGRHYWNFNRNTTWANRLFMGIGYAYGNSSALPYLKQFYVGGSNSVRGFRARSLGPGTYPPVTDNTTFPDQAGDVKFEFNTELRAKLVGIVKGAVFMDAGNIWLIRENPLLPGGKFRFGQVFNELAVSTGAGIRIDASVFVIRFDAAFPVRKPWLPNGDRWVVDQVDFGSKQWRKHNLILNIAIGYPF
ncbi:BamA/TamA family outer membrane protein [Solitalea sp. MAHUQ-68]|uniref:BamA/TamA family outer membrane protein n=1 Tax=Solitalea agri TaxID=2953739 RepID=A0A9X2F4J3_9SPHI|nr:BamA/TamA family outer membrane protein [Solitalea agri]MCO4294659.1 BamA/TamA family outer membrane protein [Solitalea agri]